MITAGINTLIISFLVLIVGLIKPKWLLFWMEKPGRLPIVAIAMLLFMVGATLFGEGNRQKHLADAVQQPVVSAPDQTALTQKPNGL